MFKLDLILSGLGITKRPNGYVARSLDSFKEVINSLNGIPVTLDHPKNTETDYKSLLSIDTDYSIIGSIDKVIFIDQEQIRVTANIVDPFFEEFYNSLTEEQKRNINTSPCVTSVDKYVGEVNSYPLFSEEIQKVDHLAVLLPEFGMLEGYWQRYVNDFMAKDYIPENYNNIQHSINKNDLKENIDMITEIPNTASIAAEPIAPIVNQTPQADDNNEPIVTEPVDDNGPVSPVAVIEEPAKVDGEGEGAINDEPKVDGDEPKVDGEALIEEPAKVDGDEPKVDGEALIEENKEEIQEVVNDDLITDDFETEEDKKKEVIVELVSNLVDSVEGFRKPMIKERVKAHVYLKKALSLNKEHIDSKYHSVIDSIDASSLEFGKDILKSINREAKGKALSHEYVQISANTFAKKFI